MERLELSGQQVCCSGLVYYQWARKTSPSPPDSVRVSSSSSGAGRAAGGAKRSWPSAKPQASPASRSTSGSGTANAQNATNSEPSTGTNAPATTRRAGGSPSTASASRCPGTRCRPPHSGSTQHSPSGRSSSYAAKAGSSSETPPTTAFPASKPLTNTLRCLPSSAHSLPARPPNRSQWTQSRDTSWRPARWKKRSSSPNREPDYPKSQSPSNEQQPSHSIFQLKMDIVIFGGSFCAALAVGLVIKKHGMYVVPQSLSLMATNRDYFDRQEKQMQQRQIEGLFTLPNSTRHLGSNQK